MENETNSKYIPSTYDSHSEPISKEKQKIIKERFNFLQLKNNIKHLSESFQKLGFDCSITDSTFTVVKDGYWINYMFNNDGIFLIDASGKEFSITKQDPSKLNLTELHRIIYFNIFKKEPVPIRPIPPQPRWIKE